SGEHHFSTAALVASVSQAWSRALLPQRLANQRWRRLSLLISILALSASFFTAEVATAQSASVGVRLELLYADPTDNQSGGTCQLSAVEFGSAGIAGLTIQLEGVDFGLPATPQLNTPGVFGWDAPMPILDLGGGVTQLLFAQDISQPGLVFNIGGGVGTPGAQGADIFQLGLDNAALLASGSFSPGDTPSFSTLPVGDPSVFTSSGSNAIEPASLLTLTVDNLFSGVPGDYNGNGSVGIEDYTVWSLNFGSSLQLGADGNGNGIVDVADYTIWRDNFAASSGAIVATPEPCSFLLAALCVGLGVVPIRTSAVRRG
ncbi:MAG: hypothetical protein AAGF31_10740, partial [Planctomycetota bacterium]